MRISAEGRKTIVLFSIHTCVAATEQLSKRNGTWRFRCYSFSAARKGKNNAEKLLTNNPSQTHLKFYALHTDRSVGVATD